MECWRQGNAPSYQPTKRSQPRHSKITLALLVVGMDATIPKNIFYFVMLRNLLQHGLGAVQSREPRKPRALPALAVRHGGIQAAQRWHFEEG